MKSNSLVSGLASDGSSAVVSPPRSRITTRFFIIPFIIAIAFTGMPSCVPAERKIIGSWQSVSITNPGRLFKNAIPDGGAGTVMVTFTSEGKYIWRDRADGSPRVGTMIFSSGRINMRDSQTGEMTRVEYGFSDGRLVITTEDRFTFTFRRTDSR